ncbi:MAG TPA: 4'-phosphopantetheinyl transferase superfamily protein [Ktedonobacterales bacterium]|nr:4'-phosphopantetheinyl transferase superfamily protein [Ktedonobacterales bacterium]
MTSASEFLEYSPTEPLVLGSTEVHVWRGWLDLPASRIQHLKQTLAVEERTRASRFRFSTDRNRFIAARGTLRAILGRYLSKDPHTLRFAYNGYGKPVLIEELENDPIQFNVTHSRNLALYAFTRQGEIGVDVEEITAEAKDYENLAQRFFSAAEVRELRSVPVEERQAAFLNGWTRKEAYIKARGLGLSLDLRQFDVSLTPGVPAALLANREAGQEHTLWSLYELAPGPGFTAALAVKGSIEMLRCWHWPA